MLVSGLFGALGVGAFSVLEHQVETQQPPPPPRPPSVVTVERVRSQARRREVDLVTVTPEGGPRTGLPVCVVLHGRYRPARGAVRNLPEWHSTAVSAGTVPPFAIVTVDGGMDNYWHGHPGDDPMGMLLEELPHWLSERGLAGPDGAPFAAAGLSMGGFGTLLYARRRHELGLPLRAASVVSPALFTRWSEVRERRAFADEAEWAALDPLRHVDELGGVRLGVWSGTEDLFVEGTRELVERAEPEKVLIGPGVHEDPYFDTAFPRAVEFVGRWAPHGEKTW